MEKHAGNPTLGFGSSDELLGAKTDAPQTLFDIDKSEEFENLHSCQVKREQVPSLEKNNRPNNFCGKRGEVMKE